MRSKILKSVCWSVTIIIAVLILCSCNSGTTRDQQLVCLYRQALPTVVMVSGDRIDDWGWEEGKTVGVATGFFINERYVLTNAHVANIIADGTVKLQLWNKDIISAEKVAIDNHNDLALLEIDPNDIKFYDIPKLNFETVPQIGETVFIIGSPYLYYNTMTVGIFSRGTTIGNDYRWIWDCEVYFVDAGVEGGNSGSPVLDADLGVIGIVTGYCGKLTVVIPSYNIRSFLLSNGFSSDR